MSEERRTCRRCGQEKPTTSSHFPWDRKAEGILHTVCRVCNREKASRWSRENLSRKRRHARKSYRKLKLDVLTAYSKGPPFCRCCGEKHVEFLALDHVNNDGASQRRALSNGRRERSNDKVYRWARANGYPPTLLVLCHNCNAAKEYSGGCPHSREKGPTDNPIHLLDVAKAESYCRSKGLLTRNLAESNCLDCRQKFDSIQRASADLYSIVDRQETRRCHRPRST